MQVSSLTVEEFKLLIQETVTETIQSLLVDPDYGAHVKPGVEKRLRESLRQAQAGEQRGIPIAEVARTLGIDWE